jgi:8-oxo-dGTP pyrophosphatase MutT (NUDIX family)
MPRLDDIAKGLSSYEPRLVEDHDGARAAVAMILRERDSRPEVLFIERARHEGDPWSGHMAFPGGRVDPEDEGSTLRAAERETLEEVGLSLRDAVEIGRLDDLQGRPRRSDGLLISAHVFHLESPGPLRWNHEVEQAFWFPVAGLLDEARHVPYPRQWQGMEMPGILVGEPGRHIVWGLTYRFIDVFLDAIGRPLPSRWTEFR